MAIELGKEYIFRSKPGLKRRLSLVIKFTSADTLNRGDQLFMSFGYSVCSPKDQFNKKLGRDIAKGRLEKHPITVPLEVQDSAHVFEAVHNFIDGLTVAWNSKSYLKPTVNQFSKLTV